MNDLATKSQPEGSGQFDLLDLALVLSENIRLLLLAPLMGGVLGFGIASLITPTYTATMRILPPQQQQSAAANLLTSQLGALAGLAGAAGIRSTAEMYAAMIKSRTVADRLLTRFKLRELYDVEYDEDARKVLADQTKITIGKDGLIVLDVDDHDPKRAADLANAYVEELHQLTQNLAVTEAAQRRLFFEKQLKQAKDDLTKSEIALRSSGISEAALKTVPQSALEALARLKAQITAQEVRIAAMRGYMTDSNPELKFAQQELAALHAQLEKVEEIDSSKATGSGAEYIARFRDFKYYETLFDLMAKQYEVARLDEAREAPLIQVVDPATPPERKSKPRRTVITIIGMVSVLLLTVLWVFLQRALHQAAAEPGYAEKMSRLRRLMLFRRS